jgi:hypothetical protein
MNRLGAETSDIYAATETFGLWSYQTAIGGSLLVLLQNDPSPQLYSLHSSHIWLPRWAHLSDVAVMVLRKVRYVDGAAWLVSGTTCGFGTDTA